MILRLTNHVTKIGRHESNDINVQSRYVSRKHLEIHNNKGSFIVKNLSSNGTYVNRALISEMQRLVNGDEIYLAQDTVFYYQDGKLSDRPFSAFINHTTWADDKEVFALSKPIVTIGRNPENDIKIHSKFAKVSRKHAEIHNLNNQHRIYNLAPTGTTINGKFIQEKILTDGDVIYFAGEIKFVFSQGTLREIDG